MWVKGGSVRASSSSMPLENHSGGKGHGRAGCALRSAVVVHFVVVLRV